MRIAILSPPMNPLSLNMKYGGIERVVLSLMEGCLTAGHDVTVYAPHRTNLNGKKVEIYSKAGSSLKRAELELFKMIISHQKRYDVIHSFLEPVIAKEGNNNYFEQISQPLIFTFENSTRVEEHLSYYRTRKTLWGYQFVFISKNHAAPMRFLPRQVMIYNGVNLDNINYSPRPKEQLGFLGRIMPEKGIEEAIALAQILDLKLKIAAKIDENNIDYFKRRIEPQLNGNIAFLGEVGAAERNALLGECLASVFLINWHEPFGLSVVESLAAGTPVIARERGALPEIVEDGKSGLIIPCDYNIARCANLFRATIEKINRQECRARAEQFSEQKMVKEYLRLYQRNLN